MSRKSNMHQLPNVKSRTEQKRREFFATAYSVLTADAATSLPTSDANCSPVPQVSAPFGDLIGLETAEKPGDLVGDRGIIRHGGQTPGEQFDKATQTAQRSDRECDFQRLA
jgi:hypothetical protein